MPPPALSVISSFFLFNLDLEICLTFGPQNWKGGKRGGREEMAVKSVMLIGPATEIKIEYFYLREGPQGS